MIAAVKDKKLILLLAAIITILAVMVLVDGLRNENGQGGENDRNALEQISTITIQLMIAFWIILIGFLVYRFLNHIRISRSRVGLKIGPAQGILPYAVILLAMLIFLFLAKPFEPDGLMTNQPEGMGQTNTTSYPTGGSSQIMPTMFPLVVILIALTSIVIVWRFLRQDPASVHAEAEPRQEQALEVLDKALVSLYAGEDPGSTIIRTYQQMCLLVQVDKLDNEPYLTPKEFAELAVRDLGWSEGPLFDLTQLFEEARYSDHLMGEPQKERAIASFNELRNALEVRENDGTAQ